MGDYGNSAVDLGGLGELGTQWVLDRLGISPRSETFVDVQVSSLLIGGLADDNARKNCIRGSGGNLLDYGTTYKAFQRDYKKRYNKQFLTRLGYAPTTSATTRVLDIPAVLAYVQLTDALADTVERVFIRHISAEEAAYDWMEDNIGWSNKYSTIDIGDGKTWEELVISDDGTDIQMDFTREPIETIVDDLTTNYSYDDINETVLIASELYDVPALNGTDLGGYYRTTVTLQSDGVTTVDIDTTVETLNYNTSNDVIDDEKMFVRYNRGGAEWYYYIEDLATIPGSLYTEVSVDLTAIIPLKEDGNIIDGGVKQDRMLKRLNLDADTFTTSLANDGIESAYVMTGLPPETQTHGGKKTIFTMFNLMLEGSGDVSLSLDRLSMTYSFTMDKNTVEDSVMPTGEYSNVLTSEYDEESGFWFYTRTIRYQATDTQYKEIVVTNFLQTYVISGQTVHASFADSGDVCRLVIPLSVLNGLRYRDWVEVYEESLAMLAYAKEVVEFEWYESTNFAFVLKIVAIVITVWSLGTAVKVGIALWTMAAYITLAYVVAAAVVVGIAVSYAVNAIMDYLINDLGLAPALAAIVVLAAAYFGAKVTNISVGTEQWLQLANKILDKTTAEYEHMTLEIMERSAEYIDEMREKNEYIVSQLEAFGKGDAVISMFNMDIMNQPSPAQAAERYVADAQNLFGFDHLYDIESQVRRRTQVPQT